MFWYLRLLLNLHLLLLSYKRSPLLDMPATMLVGKSRQERAKLKGQARRVVSKKKMSIEIRSLVVLPFGPAGSLSPLRIGNKTNPRNRSGSEIGYVVLERTIVLLVRNSRDSAIDTTHEEEGEEERQMDRGVDPSHLVETMTI
jgi:hypothetical protein